jgi:hypothetical protein
VKGGWFWKSICSALITVSYWNVPAGAQDYYIQYSVSLDDIWGAPTIVPDGELEDNNPLATNVSVDFEATNGAISITGTLTGIQIPPAEINGHYGRRLTVTNVTVDVPPGSTLPAHEAELVACYGFLGGPVEPAIVLHAIGGTLTNLAPQPNEIDLAALFWGPVANDCVPPGPGDLVGQAVQVLPSVAVQAGAGPFGSPSVSSLASYYRFELSRDGDAILLPNSAMHEAVRDTGSVIPVLSPWGVALLAGMLMLGAWVMYRRQMRLRAAV